MALSILICDKIEEGAKLLKEKGYEITRAWNKPKIELPKIAGEYAAFIVRSVIKVKGSLLANAKPLHVIGIAGEGLDNIDLEKAKDLGITVVNTPLVSHLRFDELTIGHLLALARGKVEGTQSLREGKWIKDRLIGTEFNGKTLGIIGCGHIGKAVERMAVSLGMKVLAVDECVFDRFVDLDNMLAHSDFISIHVPLTPQTCHMISTNEFNMMKNCVMIIDCSCGGVVDQESLYKALISGKVIGVAVGVFEEETPEKKQIASTEECDCYTSYRCSNQRGSVPSKHYK